MKDRPLIEVAPHRDVVCLLPGATVQEACTRMRGSGTSAALVIDPEGHLLGIFTGRDAICRVVAEARDASTTPIADVMTRSVEALGPRARAIDALHLMHDGGFRHVPIVDDGRVRGIVVRSDFRAIERARIEFEDEIFEDLR